MIKRYFIIVAFIPLCASAADTPKSGMPPTVVARVFACRSVQDAAARLVCLDREVTLLERAYSTGDLITMDRLQVRTTRRSLFGLALPNLGVFGDNGADANSGVLETVISRAHQDANSKWTFDLVEGGRWIQLDTREFAVDPEAGQSIKIRRASMGSYLANVNKQVAVRVERIR